MAPHKARELLRAATTRKNTDLHFRKAELCALTCYNDVGAQRQFEPTAKRKSFDRRDERFWAVHDRAPVFLHVARHDLDRTRLRHLANVGTGGKSDIRPGDNDTTHGIVGTAARDFVSNPRAHIQIERISHLRAIDLQNDNVAGRTFNNKGIRRGHGNPTSGMTSGSYLADGGPGRLFAASLFAIWIDHGQRVDDAGPNLVALARDAVRGPDEAGTHLRRREFRLRCQQKRRDP